MANEIKKFNRDGRFVKEVEFHNTANSDGTKSFRTFLSSLVYYTLSDKYPTRIHFYITKNANSKLSEANQILDLYLPIIPPIYDTSNESSLGSFVKNGPDFPETPSETIERRAEKEIDRLMTYLTFELANRFLKAKKTGDKVIMNQIRNLSIMEDEKFDFELYEIARDYPTKLVKTKSGYCLTSSIDPDQESTPITADQAEKYMFYKESLERHPSKKDSSGKPLTKVSARINELLGKLVEYNEYPLTHSQRKNPYGTSQKNRKLSNGNIVEDRRKPSQPGEDE